MTLDWKQIAQQKRESIVSAIPSEWRITAPSVEEVKDVTGAYIEQYLSAKEIEITNTDAVGIVAKATSGTWSSVEITKAFCHRAALAHQLTNCLHEVFFDAALKEAKELDALYAQGKTRGPLHGLPVSLKDQFHVKDVETSMGYVGWIGTFQGKKNDKRFKTYESVMVQELRSLGAVLYVKTAVPHTLMCGETVNNIIGWTMNPKNRMLSSGGSSGGEGALIGAHGSPVGLGTDIGGSIRCVDYLQRAPMLTEMQNPRCLQWLVRTTAIIGSISIRRYGQQSRWAEHHSVSGRPSGNIHRRCQAHHTSASVDISMA